MQTAAILGPLTCFLSSLTWALGVSAYTTVSKNFLGYRINFTRALIAAPLFLLFSVFEAGSPTQVVSLFSMLDSHHLGWLSLSMLSSYALGDVFFLMSTQKIGVPAALAIASSYPIWAALAGMVFQGEHLSASRWLGLILVFLGSGVVILSGYRAHAKTGADKKNYATGIFLAVLVSVFWSLNTFSISQVKDLSASVVNVTRFMIAFFLCPFLGWVLWKGGVFKQKLTTSDFVNPKAIAIPFSKIQRVFPIFILEAFGGSLFFVYGLAHTPLSIGAALTSLAPVLSVPIAWAMRLEAFSALRFTGVVAVTLGIWLLVGSI